MSQSDCCSKAAKEHDAIKYSLDALTFADARPFASAEKQS
jgi:hypothetical protein